MKRILIRVHQFFFINNDPIYRVGNFRDATGFNVHNGRAILPFFKIFTLRKLSPIRSRRNAKKTHRPQQRETSKIKNPQRTENNPEIFRGHFSIHSTRKKPGHKTAPRRKRALDSDTRFRNRDKETQFTA